MGKLYQEGTVPALRVRQWLPEWEEVNFDPRQGQAKPDSHFYMFSLSAAQLRRYSAIYRRDASDMKARKDDYGIQRRHDLDRSAEIGRYVVEGFPRSALSDRQRKDPDNDSLRKPGWLPTAVVVNILNVGDMRNGRKIDAKHAIEISDNPEDVFATLKFPTQIDEAIPPIEVIDGQHRLFAFDDEESGTADFELPVVAFRGLDISWQAYLFWTINIKPKKINASLAFDLYPLLREQDWLDRGDKILVYRESRAQELTEILWSTPTSPWYKRINMLGGPRKETGPVTQAAFTRSLTASLVKSWVPTSSTKTGGLFGGMPNQNEGLAWSRVQQGAFLVTAWHLMAKAVKKSSCEWAVALRSHEEAESDDPAFDGSFTLLATDQGVRGFQQVINDLTYINSSSLRLTAWNEAHNITDVSAENIQTVAETIPDRIRDYLTIITEELSTFDWRTTMFPGLPEDERLKKAAFRGSGGYRELREQLISHLGRSDRDVVVKAVAKLQGAS